MCVAIYYKIIPLPVVYDNAGEVTLFCDETRARNYLHSIDWNDERIDESVNFVEVHNGQNC